MKRRKLTITKLLTSLLALFLFTSIVSSNVFAEDGDEVYFKHHDDHEYGVSAEQDVVAVINGSSVDMTYYCLQRHLTRPVMEKPKGGYVKYVESADAKGKIGEDVLNKIAKVAYAGYPNNSVGILDEVYAQGTNFYSADYWAADITQEAIWAIVEKAHLEGNNETVDSRELQYGWMPECYLKAFQDLVAFGEDESNTVPEAASSGVVTITGDAVFEKEGKNFWSTGYLSITDPIGYQMDFELPEGISAVDKDGNTLTHLISGKEFRLVTADPFNIKADSKLTINTTITYPDGTTCYVQNEDVKRSDNPGSVELIYYQIITASKVGTAKVKGSIDLTVGEQCSSVSISKMIAEGSEDAAKGIDFKFNVVVKDENGEPVSGVLPTVKHCGTDGRTTVEGTVDLDENGKCQVELQGGDRIVIDGLPLDSSVTVTEVEVKGWTADVSEETEDNEIYIIVTNTYDPESAKDPTDGNGSGTDKPGNGGSESSKYKVPDTSCR